MNKIILTTSRGLDELLKQEVLEICPDSSPQLKPGQVILEGQLADAYRLCLWSRLANRVLWVLHEGFSDDASQLYESVRAVDWSQHLNAHSTFVVNFNGTNRAITNSQFGAQRVKDGIVDHFVEQGLARLSVEKFAPDVMIQARLWRDKVVLAVDLSGGSLHQRGYRTETGEAPLKEHVASALLMRSGWSKSKSLPLFDPMCGSGTIAIEAAMMATNRAPARNRKRWGFAKWAQHDERLWQSILSHADQQICEHDSPIVANDNQSRLIAIAKKNADQAGVFKYITFSQQDALKLKMDFSTPGFMVSNPPYGERLSDIASLVPFFNEWGGVLKQAFGDWKVSLLSSQRELLRQLKMRAKNEYSLMNGKLECKLVNYVIDEANREVRENNASSEFANRLKKNIKQLQRFLKKVPTDAYRLYDADLPDYNVAIDVYGDWLIVQEYAAPKNIPPEKAQRRLNEVIIQLPTITGFAPEKIAVKVRSQQKGKQQYQRVASQEHRFAVEEYGAKFLINPTDYLDCGLFLDHRETRQIVAKMARGKNVLNLFAYTGSVSVMCALHGARSVTTVDLSKTYLDWAKENFALNKLKGPYQFHQGDCVEWLDNDRHVYDVIFIDPPSFSNSKRMESTWDVQRDHVKLLTNAYRRLNNGGVVVFSNNLRSFKLDNDALEAVGFSVENISSKTLTEDFKRNPKIHQCWLLTK